MPAGVGEASRGLVKAFRYGLVMPGGSRIVMDLKRPAKIDKAYVVEAENGQLPKLIVELTATDRASFMQAHRCGKPEGHGDCARQDGRRGGSRYRKQHRNKHSNANDTRPVVVIDPGHGGIDEGAQTESGENEKTIVLDFAKALRARIEKAGKYRVVMTRDDDTFIPLAERVKIARQHKAALFLSVHADSLPRGRAMRRGRPSTRSPTPPRTRKQQSSPKPRTAPTLIAGINLTEEPAEVADILIDLARRETKTFSNRFARTLVKEMKQRRAHSQESAEIGGLSRAEGAGCAVGAAGTRLCVEQGRLSAARVRQLALPHGRFGGAGGGIVFRQARGGHRAQKRRASELLRALV